MGGHQTVIFSKWKQIFHVFRVQSLNQNKIRKNSVPDLKQTATKSVKHIISKYSLFRTNLD